MAKFFAQMFSWVATDVIVKGLSNSRTFQRVVLKVDKFQSTAEKLAEEKATEAIKMAQEVEINDTVPAQPTYSAPSD